MGNFGCCQGKPATIESSTLPQNHEPKAEPLQIDIEKTVAEEILKPVEDKPKTKVKRKSKPRKSSNISEEKKIEKKLEMPKFSQKDFVQLRQGSVENTYTITNLLGKGSFGFVYKAKHKFSDSFRAVKVLKKENLSEITRLKLLQEVEILKTLDHPNILKIFEVFEDGNSINLITELCTGGELFDRIVSSKCFSENRAALYLYQIMSAVIACHDKGIVHRDLKPENILFTDESEFSSLKVIDFGTSRKLEPNSTLSSLTGTVTLT
jgi:calcium-dependent protein kinase